MIQTTAPATSAAPSPAAGTLPAALPTGAFAALLAPVGSSGDTGAPLEVVPGSVEQPSPSKDLPEALKGAQDGLAALVRQAGAATQPSTSAASTAIPAAATPTQRNPAQVSVSKTILPKISVSQGVSAASLATALQTPTPTLRSAHETPTSEQSVKASAPVTSADLLSAATPATVTEVAPAASDPVPVAAPCVQADGKSGNANGNMLPRAAETRRHKPLVDSATDAVTDAAASPGGAMATSADPTPTLVETVSVLPMPEIAHTAERARAPIARGEAIVAKPAQPAAVAIPAEVRAVRFEPIEIVRTASPASRTITASMTAVQAPSSQTPVAVEGESAMAPASADVADMAPSASPDARQPVATPLPRPAAPEHPADMTAQQPLPATPVVSPAPRTASEGVAVPAQTATAASQVAIRPAAADNGDRRANDARQESAQPNTSDIETEAADAPTARTVRIAEHQMPADPLAAAPTSVTASATNDSATPVPPQTETPHDFDTLVSRLAEAREAAAPHMVRTAFEHAEFGRVALQLGQDEGGLSVTLSSRDAEFAPAVQAAAAAVASGAAGGGMSSNTGSTPDQPRQDNSSSQQQNPNAAQAGFNGSQGQSAQGQQARADASAQQQRRDGGASRQPEQSAHPRDERRQGGVYA